MKVAFTCALASAFILANPALAQTTVQPSPIIGASDATVLRTGTPVAMKLAETITTKGKKLRVGYRVRLEVAEPVLVNGVTVIPVGSPAVGEVTDVRNKGMWGKSGHINAQVLYVMVNGRQIRMSGQFDDKGVTGTAAVVGSIALIPVAGFFMTGTSATLPTGGPVKGFIDEDVPLNLTAVQAAPLTVPVPSQPMTTPAVATTPVSAIKN